MIKIYKYGIEERGCQIVKMHSDYNILDMSIQDEKIFLWAIVDTEKPIVDVQIEMFGTGHTIDNLEGLKYIRTVHWSPFVWHFFERLKYEVNNMQKV